MMAIGLNQSSLVLLLVFVLVLIPFSDQLQSSQAETLLGIQQLLNHPNVLSIWNNTTDFCNTEPTSSLTVVCYDDSITQLHIIGTKRAPPLPRNFSMDSFVTTLVKLPDLKVLTLVSLGLRGSLPSEISRLSSLEIVNMSSNYFHGVIPREVGSLANLQTLILDENMLSGRFPDSMTSLSVLTVLSLRKNLLNGSLPELLGTMDNLRVLALSRNRFVGGVPDLTSLKSLQVLDLEDNFLGPEFPQVGNKVVTLLLRKNKFSSGIPDEVSSYHQLQKLDLSFNKFVGPFPPLLLALPSMTYLSIAGNRFTGMLFENLSCSSQLEFVDMSSNLLTGHVPSCFRLDSKNKFVHYSGNCLFGGDKTQKPVSFCRNQAFAVGILPRRRKSKHGSKVVLALSISGGIVGGLALVGLAFLIVRRAHSKHTTKKTPLKIISDNASTGYTPKLLSDARYVSETMKLGALGLPAYRTYLLEDLEDATLNFNTSTLLSDGPQGQIYRGKLMDGSFIAIRCVKMKRRHNIQSFTHHLELISKLRHQHLVSTLGHCFDCHVDDSSVSRLFLIFEYVPNGTLRSWISERRGRRALSWTQRITAAIGVAKGIQFLHTGIFPGIYSNKLKITDVSLDQNMVPKISSYNLPFIVENIAKVGSSISSGRSRRHKNARVNQEEKSDIYDFGVILLEIIVGRSLNLRNEVDAVREQLNSIVTSEDAARRSMVDPGIHNSCSEESLKTMMEVCTRCLLKDPELRPSIEDVLWNLQFAAQVQEAWGSRDGSPVLFNQPPRLE